MPRDRCSFRQRDLRVAIATVRAAGLLIARIEVSNDGGFKVITTGTASELDEDEIERGTRHIDEVISHALEQKGPQVEKRPTALRLHSPKPTRKR